jgi:hypothetical protein
LPSGDQRGARHPICLSALWPSRRRNDGECHYLPWPIGSPRSGKSSGV